MLIVKPPEAGSKFHFLRIMSFSDGNVTAKPFTICVAGITVSFTTNNKVIYCKNLNGRICLNVKYIDIKCRVNSDDGAQFGRLKSLT